MNRKALLPVVVSLGVFVVIFGVVALYLWNASRQTVSSERSQQSVSAVKELPQLEVNDEPVASTKQVIGGDLKVTGTVSIIDGLPLHHSFISLLKAGKIIIGLHNDQQKILDIEKGLLRVKDNKVTVFLDV